MNIPLNIDWQQILLHLFNFTILAGGLYLLLYKPVKDFMNKRTAHYEEMEKQAQDALKEANDSKALYEAQLLGAANEIREQKANAEKEMDVKAAARLELAHKQAEKIVSDAKQSAEAERRKIVDAARQDIVNLATEAAEKLVRQSLNSVGRSEAHGE